MYNQLPNHFNYSDDQNQTRSQIGPIRRGGSQMASGSSSSWYVYDSARARAHAQTEAVLDDNGRLNAALQRERKEAEKLKKRVEALEKKNRKLEEIRHEQAEELEMWRTGALQLVEEPVQNHDLEPEPLEDLEFFEEQFEGLEAFEDITDIDAYLFENKELKGLEKEPEKKIERFEEAVEYARLHFSEVRVEGCDDLTHYLFDENQKPKRFPQLRTRPRCGYDVFRRFTREHGDMSVLWNAVPETEKSEWYKRCDRIVEWQEKQIKAGLIMYAPQKRKRAEYVAPVALQILD